MATKRRVECDSAPSCAIPENQEANSEIQQLLARALANSQAEEEYKHYTAISYKKQARRYVIKVSIRRTSNCIYNAQILCIHACIHVYVYTCNLANWFSALIILLSTKNIPLYHFTFFAGTYRSEPWAVHSCETKGRQADHCVRHRGRKDSWGQFKILIKLLKSSFSIVDHHLIYLYKIWQYLF